MILYQPEHFTITELVHPDIIKSIGELNSWLRLDTLVLMDLDTIRDAWGDIIYVNLGPHDSRGYRPPNDPDGAFFSVHKQGKAFDLIPDNGDVQGLYQLIYNLIKSGALKSINTLENPKYTKSWVHAASMNTSEVPLIVNP